MNNHSFRCVLDNEKRKVVISTWLMFEKRKEMKMREITRFCSDLFWKKKTFQLRKRKEIKSFVFCFICQRRELLSQYQNQHLSDRIIFDNNLNNREIFDENLHTKTTNNHTIIIEFTIPFRISSTTNTSLTICTSIATFMIRLKPFVWFQLKIHWI